jgi:DNA (cytosine-5)-methyltransferase 1
MKSGATQAPPLAGTGQRGNGTSGLALTLRPLAEALDRIESSGWGTGGDDVRNAAKLLAETAASDLDGLWSRAKSSPAGPIDVIDSFSGCGGMSAGFRAINGAVGAYRLAAAVDIAEVANRTYEANYGLSPTSVDIAEVARGRRLFSEIRGARRMKAPLVLIGCAPCQGFSSHRNKAGIKDARNSLFGDFARIAVRLRPDAVVVENVPELLTDRYWPFLTEARSRLEQSGYYVHLTVHNMAEFGLPQERFRALMVAMPKPFRAPTGFLSRSEFRTVRHAIGDLPRVKAGDTHPSDEMHYSAGHKRSTIETIRAVPKDGGSRPEHIGPDCLRRAAKKNGRAVYEDVYGRLFWDRPAITITAYARNPASGRYVHPEQDRGLTVREAALLQGFPRDYWFAGSLDQRFRQIGNAVPPTFAVFLAAHLLGELLAEPARTEEFEPGITEPVGPSFSRLIPALKAGHRQEVLSGARCSA